ELRRSQHSSSASTRSYLCGNAPKSQSLDLISVKVLPIDYYDKEFGDNYDINVSSDNVDISEKLPPENATEMQAIFGSSGDTENLSIKSLANSDIEKQEENPTPDVKIAQLFPCDLCHNHNSRTMKGQRLHLIWTHKIGIVKNRSLDSHGRPLDYFDITDDIPESMPDFDTDDPEELFELQMKWAMEESAHMAAAQ
ncbi:hypothetical protein AVEN_106105-1, partial [Araneus ventricosus]